MAIPAFPSEIVGSKVIKDGVDELVTVFAVKALFE